MLMKHAKIFVVLSALVLFIVSCSPPAPEDPLKSAATPAQNAPPSPAHEGDMGTELYATNCMICHKDTGKGGRVTMQGKTINPEDLTTDKMKKMSDDKLFGYISDGIEDEGMPAFKDKLKPEEIKSVITHIRTLQNQN